MGLLPNIKMNPLYISTLLMTVFAQQTAVGTGNDPACQAPLQQAQQIVTTMEQLLANVQSRGASATGQNLVTNLNDLATYEAAVRTVDPLFNQAAACNGVLQLNARYLTVRTPWFQAKNQIRNQQLPAGLPDGTSAI